MQTREVKEYTNEQVIEKTRETSELTHKVLNEISSFIKPGISEIRAREVAGEVLESYEIKKSWHKPYIYFGQNTILTFMDKPTEEKILQESDIAYIDIGPIINGIEGDSGHTLVFGINALFLDLKLQSERIFKLALDFWKKSAPTGIVLYEYIYKLTNEAGYVFNLNPAGHLIGSFPHKGWKKGLNTYPHTPEPGYWILEVQIRHPKEPYGAFYEKVLL
jgi:Xaa-Pro aminopeptidase